jgi:hypothetical protein
MLAGFENCIEAQSVVNEKTAECAPSPHVFTALTRQK